VGKKKFDLHSRGVLAVIASVVLAGSVAACGDDDDDKSAAAGGAVGSGQIATSDPSAKDGIGVERPKSAPSPTAPSGVANRRSACVGVTTVPTVSTTAVTRKAVACLVNAERAARGLRPLRLSSELTQAATTHAQDMVKETYFSHVSPTGQTLVDRLKQVGFLTGAVVNQAMKQAQGATQGAQSTALFVAGETLAYGTGPAVSARSLVRKWMANVSNRATLLNSRVRQIGVGIVRGAPKASFDETGVTVVTNLGTVSTG
jgi:uncharacterized protein YkwD